MWTALRLEMEAFRLYAFAGAACGMALYGVTLGMLARRIAAGVRRMMEKTGEKTQKAPGRGRKLTKADEY